MASLWKNRDCWKLFTNDVLYNYSQLDYCLYIPQGSGAFVGLDSQGISNFFSET
ncbi:MAG: hypothetical protein JJE21_07120 [Spirochaetaceae bacterium]|nr:hypothetical protein [Spirochaetaceae bacterium]